MNILKAIKEYFCPTKYSGLEIAEMGKHIKFDYFIEALDLIYDSNKLTDNEKDRLVNKFIQGYNQNKYISKKNFEYLKKKLA